MLDSSPHRPVTAPGLSVRTRTGPARAWVAGRLTTTPGRLVLLSLLVIVVATSFGVAASLAEHSRARAANDVRTQTEPLLVQSVLLDTALSDANATATATFLHGGLEPPARRAHYLADVRLATDSVVTLTRQAGATADTRLAVRTITNELPVYTGLIEAARSNNRQGYPIGAAYLRQASALLTGTILPRARQLYANAATRLGSDYSTGTSTATLVVLIVAVVVALGLLVAGQLYLARMSRRVFNLPMLVATVILAGVSIWAVAALIGEQNALARARSDSDAVEVLSAGRVLLSRAQSDQSLILANRGSDQTDPADLTAVMAALSPGGSLVAQASAELGADSAASRRLNAQLAAYRAQTARITAVGNSGQIAQASQLSASDPAAARLDAELSAQATAAQRRFEQAAGDATSWVSGLSIVIAALAVAGCVLAVFGVSRRLGEYR